MGSEFLAYFSNALLGRREKRCQILKTFFVLFLNSINIPCITLEEQQQIVENSAEHTKLQYNLVQNTQIVQYMIDNAKWLFDENNSKKDHAHVTTVKINNNNQLPPQFLERVKFINVEEQQPVSLSKR